MNRMKCSLSSSGSLNAFFLWARVFALHSDIAQHAANADVRNQDDPKVCSSGV